MLLLWLFSEEKLRYASVINTNLSLEGFRLFRQTETVLRLNKIPWYVYELKWLSRRKIRFKDSLCFLKVELFDLMPLVCFFRKFRTTWTRPCKNAEVRCQAKFIDLPVKLIVEPHQFYAFPSHAVATPKLCALLFVLFSPSNPSILPWRKIFSLIPLYKCPYEWPSRRSLIAR